MVKIGNMCFIGKRTEIPRHFSGAVLFHSGARAWYKDGKLHREDGPAERGSYGTKIVAQAREANQQREKGWKNSFLP